MTDININTNPHTNNSEQLKMLSAAYTAIPPTLASDALASSFLTLAYESYESKHSNNFKYLCMLLHQISNVLGSLYDGYSIIKAIFRLGNTSTKYCHIITSLVYQCTILIAPSPPTNIIQRNNKRQRPQHDFSRSSRTKYPLQIIDQLTKTRKIILHWCVTDFASTFYTSIKEEERNRFNKEKEIHRMKRKNDFAVGAGIPNFQSKLDENESITQNQTSSTETFMKTIRYLLFLNDPKLFNPSNIIITNDESLSNELLYRNHFCSAYGTDLDDEMIRIILDSTFMPNAGITSTVAIDIIEHLFLKCQLKGSSIMHFSNCDLVWDLYHLSEYIPTKSMKDNSPNRETNEDIISLPK